jgi:thymidylate synthase (FAD)
VKIVKASYKILRPERLKDALSIVEYAARISHRSEDGMTEDSAPDFLRRVVMERADWSVAEHESFSVEFVVDRGITHELVRHRLASYTQESTRFVNYVKKMPPVFIYFNPEVECPFCINGDTLTEQGKHIIGYESSRGEDCRYYQAWVDSIRASEVAYQKLIASGVRPQEARSILPNALAAKLLMTCNLRNWRHFFLMRTTKQAHPQMREVTIPLLEEVKRLVPVLFEDIEPLASQAHNARLGR